VARRGASRGSKKRTPVMMWLIAGILIGLGMAWYLAAKGYLPQPQQQQPVASEPAGGQTDEAVLTEEASTQEEKPRKPRYDFFTVLPEMEVVVPEQELYRKSQPEGEVSNDSASYLLQVGSFKSSEEADQMKAQLALSGFSATIHSVKVNDASWHRVRIGPVQGARQADDIRRRLLDSGIDSLVMKSP
jgi:cell division protein FtsN